MLTLRAFSGGTAHATLPVTVHDAHKQQRPGAHSKRRSLERIVWCTLVLCVLAPTAVFAHFHRSKSALGVVADLAQPEQGTLPMAAPTNFPAAQLQNLVLVAGHAVYTGVDYSRANKEASWFLEDYQKVPGEAQSFIDHIRLGVQEAAKDPAALLLFSGGQTRSKAGPRSEGMSYWVVAEAAQWFNASAAVRARAYTEEHARDSFENLLFSMCRFYELTGHYPQRVTVVSYTLKRRRFEELHRAALHFPASRFVFVGSDVPPGAKGAVAGEAKTVAAFMADPYGCSPDLRAKKQRRDPFAVGPPHPSRCPGMAPLLSYCSHKLYDGHVPWAGGGGSSGSSSSSKSSSSSSSSGGGGGGGAASSRVNSGSSVDASDSGSGAVTSTMGGIAPKLLRVTPPDLEEGVPGPHGSLHIMRRQVHEVAGASQ